MTIGYRPSAKDPWTVDGAAPQALPAGSASGRSMAAAPQGSGWAGRSPLPADPAAQDAPLGDGSPVDGPTVSRIAAVPAVAVAPETTDAPDGTTSSALRRQVFGFLPYWTLGDRTTVLDYDLLSTIAYFSVGADRSGNLLKKDAKGRTTTGWGGWTSSKLTSVIQAAHRHHTRVVLTVSVFAWTSSQAAIQAALLGSSKARLTLARQIAAAVRDRGADGVNLDFEPIASGHAANFTALVRAVRSQLDRVHRGYQLTFDTTGTIGNYPIEDATAPGGADAIFIMGYDYRTGGASTAGWIDPLDGPGYTLIDTIQAYTERVAPSKLILGLPYYGRAWTTTTSSFGAPTQTGPQYPTSSSVMYATRSPWPRSTAATTTPPRGPPGSPIARRRVPPATAASRRGGRSTTTTPSRSRPATTSSSRAGSAAVGSGHSGSTSRSPTSTAPSPGSSSVTRPPRWLASPSSRRRSATPASSSRGERPMFRPSAPTTCRWRSTAARGPGGGHGHR